MEEVCLQFLGIEIKTEINTSDLSNEEIKDEVIKKVKEVIK